MFKTTIVSHFITNLRIGRISSSLKKKHVLSSGRNLQIGKISNFKKVTYVLSIRK